LLLLLLPAMAVALVIRMVVGSSAALDMVDEGGAGRRLAARGRSSNANPGLMDARLQQLGLKLVVAEQVRTNSRSSYRVSTKPLEN
jgi:hypothetical protein